MTALSAVINSTLRHLERGHQPSRNKLNGQVSASATTWTLANDLKGIAEGSRLSCELEDVYVWSSDTTAKTAVVQRGDRGSTGAIHVTDSIVYVNTEFSRFDVLQAINEEIAELSSPVRGIFQMLSVDLTYNASIRGYDLTGVADTFLDVYELRYEETGSSKLWPLIEKFSVSRKLNTSEFASGTAIFLHEGAQAGQTIRLRYKGKLTQLGVTDETQVVETVTGLTESGVNVLPYGAAARLAAGRSIRRASMDAQGSTKRAEEVSTQDQLVSVTGLLRQRDAAIEAEAARLATQFPQRMRR